MINFDSPEIKNNLRFFLLAVFLALVLIGGYFILKPKLDEIKTNELAYQTGLALLKSKQVTEQNLNGYFAPILAFHHIAKAPLWADKVSKSLYVDPKQFESIIKELLANNYKPVFTSEIAVYLGKEERPLENLVALTFDDGDEDFYTNAWPILQKYRIKSSLYIMTGVRGNAYLSPEQIIELAQSGLVEIGSHTVYHPNLTKLTKDEQFRELKNSKEFLENLLRQKIEVICYPFGAVNDQVKDLAKQIGYKYGLTYNHSPLSDTADLFEINRIGVYPALNVIKFLERLKSKK